MNKPEGGFTLIELMITVVVFGILAAIAYPAYQNYAIRSHRVAAQSAMLEEAQRQERLLTSAGRYASSTMNTPSDQEKRYVIVTTPSADGYSYTMTATPVAGRQNDPACNVLTLNALGARNISGGEGSVSDCWRQ